MYFGCAMKIWCQKTGHPVLPSRTLTVDINLSRSPDLSIFLLTRPSHASRGYTVACVGLSSAITVAGQWRNLTALPFSETYLLFMMSNIGEEYFSVNQLLGFI